MIATITTKHGRTVHIAPDHEPVFNHSEIMRMKGLHPDAAEILALTKEIFAGAKVKDVTLLTTEKELEQMALLNFNAAETEEMQDFELLPAAEYKAAIVESDMVENSAKTGHYLKLQFQVIEGDQNGRKVFANLNLDNPNPQAVEIARSELKSICSALGKGNAVVNDSTELHDQPLIIKVKHEARKDKPGEFSAKIAKYAPIGGGTKTVNNSQPPRTGKTPPWVK